MVVALNGSVVTRVAVFAYLSLPAVVFGVWSGVYDVPLVKILQISSKNRVAGVETREEPQKQGNRLMI